MRLRSLATILAGLALTMAPALAGQSPPQQPPAKKAEQKKPKRVWTNDDLIALRRPVDRYQARKEKAEADAKAAAEQAAAQKAGQEPATPADEKKEPAPDEFVPPKTLEEAEARLAGKLEEIEFQEAKIRDVRENLFNEADAARRDEISKELERLQTSLEEAENELKLLRESVAQFRAKAPPRPPDDQP